MRAGLALGVARRGELSGFHLFAREAALAAGMGERRRADFLAGRLAARRALASLGVAVGPVLADRGRPRFPPPAIGSIAHSCGVAVALVGRRCAVGGVGVDVELGRISLRAARRICTPEELAWALAPNYDPARATALFSAKESAYKALPAPAQSQVGLADIVIAPCHTGFVARVPRTRWPEIEGGWRLGSAILTWAVTGAAPQVG